MCGMADWTNFETKPSRSDAPAECQFRGCDTRPERWVRFKSPKEYVCYCAEHVEEALSRGSQRAKSGHIRG